MRGRDAFRRTLRRLRRDQRAVSPVVGTILVLFIIIVAMAGILLWGVPAIRGLQDHAEFQSMLTQVLQLNGELSTLRDPQNTRVATISMSQGSLRVEEGSRWAITAHATSAYSGLTVTGWHWDSAPWFNFTGLPATPTTDVTIDRMDGTQPVRQANGSCATSCSINHGGYNFVGNVTRIQHKVGSELKAETWIYDAGRITYRMRNDLTLNRLHLEMGAVFAQQGNAVFMESGPTLKEPVWDFTPADTSYLSRILQLQGDTVALGKGRHTVEMNLERNYGLAQNRPLIDPARSVRLQVDDSEHTHFAATPGLLEEAYCNYLLLEPDYTAAGSCDGGDVNLLYDPPDDAAHNNGEILFELNQGVVNVRVKNL